MAAALGSLAAMAAVVEMVAVLKILVMDFLYAAKMPLDQMWW